MLTALTAILRQPLPFLIVALVAHWLTSLGSFAWLACFLILGYWVQVLQASLLAEELPPFASLKRLGIAISQGMLGLGHLGFSVLLLALGSCGLFPFVRLCFPWAVFLMAWVAQCWLVTTMRYMTQSLGGSQILTQLFHLMTVGLFRLRTLEMLLLGWLIGSSLDALRYQSLLPQALLLLLSTIYVHLAGHHAREFLKSPGWETT